MTHALHIQSQAIVHKVVIQSDGGVTNLRRTIIGVPGPDGQRGPAGDGIALGGTDGQFLKRDSTTTEGTIWGLPVKSDVGLGNVDNTADLDKPVSTAQAAADAAVQAFAIARANHTGAQAISTVTGLQTALDAKVAGPASVTDSRPVLFDGTTGKLVKEHSSALGTAAALNSGTAIGNVVVLENVGGNAGLPAVDGSQLTGIVTGASGAVAEAADRTALAAVDTGDFEIAFLREAGRKGIFEWDGSDLSAEVTADTLQGIYVPPSTDTDGSSGAWKRVYDGSTLYPEWFGAVGDGATDDSGAINAALLLGGIGAVIRLRSVCYAVADTVWATLRGQRIIGEANAARLFGDGTTEGTTLLWTGSAGGTVLKFSPVDTVDPKVSLYGVQLSNVQINGGNTAGIGLQCRSTIRSRFSGISIFNMGDDSTYCCLLVDTFASGWGDVNANHKSIWEDINIRSTGDTTGMRFQGDGVPAASSDFCTIISLYIITEDAPALHLHHCDDMGFYNLTLNRLNAGGPSLFMDGGSDGTHTVTACCFYHLWASEEILCDGTGCRRNHIYGLSGIDDAGDVVITTSNGASLSYHYIGTNSGTHTHAGDAAKAVMPPIQFQNYNIDDTTTLDWFEEGDITPTIAFGGASVGATYGTRSGTFTRIGNRVFYSIDLVLTAKGSSTGNATIGGLPYTVDTNLAAAVRTLNMTSGVGDTALSAGVVASSTTLAVYKQATGDSTILTNADFTNTSRIWATGSYIVQGL